jgi:hypothetical protein
METRLQNLKNSKRNFKSESEISLAVSVDYSLRKEIEDLSRFFLGREVNGCRNCYADAYLNLINFPQKRVFEMNKCVFELNKNKLLYDVHGDLSKLLSQANITNTLALYHLKTNPECVKFFTRMPGNWKELVAGFDIESNTVKDVVKAGNQDLQTTLGEEETELYNKIVELVKAGNSQNSIYKQFKDIETLDGEKFTSRRLFGLINKAKKAQAA